MKLLISALVLSFYTLISYGQSDVDIKASQISYKAEKIERKIKSITSYLQNDKNILSKKRLVRLNTKKDRLECRMFREWNTIVTRYWMTDPFQSAIKKLVSYNQLTVAKADSSCYINDIRIAKDTISARSLYVKKDVYERLANSAFENKKYLDALIWQSMYREKEKQIDDLTPYICFRSANSNAISNSVFKAKCYQGLNQLDTAFATINKIKYIFRNEECLRLWAEILRQGSKEIQMKEALERNWLKLEEMCKEYKRPYQSFDFELLGQEFDVFECILSTNGFEIEENNAKYEAGLISVTEYINHLKAEFERTYCYKALFL